MPVKKPPIRSLILDNTVDKLLAKLSPKVCEVEEKKRREREKEMEESFLRSYYAGPRRTQITY